MSQDWLDPINGSVHFLQKNCHHPNLGILCCPICPSNGSTATCEAKAEDLNHQEGAGQAYNVIFRLAAFAFWKLWLATCYCPTIPVKYAVMQCYAYVSFLHSTDFHHQLTLVVEQLGPSWTHPTTSTIMRPGKEPL